MASPGEGFERSWCWEVSEGLRVECDGGVCDGGKNVREAQEVERSVNQGCDVEGCVWVRGVRWWVECVSKRCEVEGRE